MYVRHRYDGRTLLPDGRDAIAEYRQYAEAISALYRAANKSEEAAALLATRSLLESLRPGRILWNPPETMTQDVRYRIEARVDSEDAAGASFTRGVAGVGASRVWREKISQVVDVQMSATPASFTIESHRPAEQVVGKDTFTQWLWTVQPHRPGEFELILNVTIVVVDESGKDRRKTIPLAPKKVSVRVSPIAASSEFIASHVTVFATLASSPFVASAIAWILVRKRRKRRIGFGSAPPNSGSA